MNERLANRVWLVTRAPRMAATTAHRRATEGRRDDVDVFVGNEGHHTP